MSIACPSPYAPESGRSTMLQISIDIPSMPDLHYKNDEPPFLDLINDTVIANPYPKELIS